jgi:hypothetical protein
VRVRFAILMISATSPVDDGCTMTSAVGVRSPRSSHICGIQYASTE